MNGKPPNCDSAADPLLSPTTTVDRLTDASDLIRQAFKSRQIDGSEPFVRTFWVDEPVAALPLLPEDASVLRGFTSDTSVVALARTPEGSILVSVQLRSARIMVSARTDALAEAIADEIRSRMPRTQAAGTVQLRTWHMGCNEQPQNDDRRITAPAWPEIERNYPALVRREIAELIALERPEAGGKLILWHGEPGTGKTFALRSLLRAWEPWCSAQYISDPERLFSHPGYISDVLTHSSAPRYGPTLVRAGNPETMWRLLIAEDTDEYLRASARRDAGAGLGRLLNLADGVLGQGFNTLVLLTTNEELHRVHPAITRPGRCLARVEFLRFPVHEACDWLSPDTALVEHPTTLAELFERRGDIARIGDTDESGDARMGQYL